MTGMLSKDYGKKPWNIRDHVENLSLYKVSPQGILYDENDPYENDIFSYSPNAIYKNYAKELDFSNKDDLIKLSMLAPSQEERGFLEGIYDWFGKDDNLDQAMKAGGKLFEGIASIYQGNKSYKLGKQSLQNDMDINRAQFTANAANAFDKENFRNTSLKHFFAGSNPEAMNQIIQNSQQYHQMIADAGQHIGINPNTFTNQLQQYNQLKA